MIAEHDLAREARRERRHGLRHQIEQRGLGCPRERASAKATSTAQSHWIVRSFAGIWERIVAISACMASSRPGTISGQSTRRANMEAKAL